MLQKNIKYINFLLFTHNKVENENYLHRCFQQYLNEIGERKKIEKRRRKIR